MQSIAQNIQTLFHSTKVLVVDDEHYTRKVLRTLLTAIGIKNVYEADDGATGLEAIRNIVPDVVLVDWEMPGLDGPSFVRAVRSPADFPVPHVPLIMLTAHGERWRVLQAMRLGVHEYLLKPVSSKTLLDRMVAILTHPRPIVKVGDYYGPEPRKTGVYRPEIDRTRDEIFLVN
jgi:YesN/AraC family two-component response regulator